MKAMNNTGIVIGAGIAGLAIAIRMARRGMRVSVYEQAAESGGKLKEFKQDGFRFDMGPSLFTLPHLVDELLDEDLRSFYRQLEVVTRYFFEDGTQLKALADVEEFAIEVEQKLGVSADKVKGYLSHAEEVFELTAPIFILNTFHRWKDVITLANFKRLLRFSKLKVFSSLHQFNKQMLWDDRLVQLFDRYATYNGSNPYQTPATLSVIAHLEHEQGAYFPKKGMHQINQLLFMQAKRLGVDFYFNTKVDEVLVEGKKVRGIRIGDEEKWCEQLVSDVDIHQFYRSLLPDRKRLKKLEKFDRSSSAMIFYWGMNKRFPDLSLHNIFFSKNYKDEFDNLFERKLISLDPTVYVFISSKENPDDAPSGCENWFVMVNAPENVGQDWEQMRRQVRKAVLTKLGRLLKENLEACIVPEKCLNPVNIEQTTGSFGGSIYGASSNHLLSAFYRHPNFRKDIEGLYFVGGSVHPGGGIPLCLSSAKIVERIMVEKMKLR